MSDEVTDVVVTESDRVNLKGNEDVISKDTNGLENDVRQSMINEPLLSYVVFALQSGTVENVKKAVLSFFSSEQILNAKNVLWKNACNVTIGKNIARRSTEVRHEEEANLGDIILAIQKLDRLDKMPEIVISAVDLGKIPRSVPEELNAISIVDRLAKLEDRFGEMQQSVVKNSNEIHACKVLREQSAKKERPTQTTSNWSNVRTEVWNDEAWNKPTDTESVKKTDTFADVLNNKTTNSVPSRTSIRGSYGRGRGQVAEMDIDQVRKLIC
jgi:hypothetical protein